MKLFFFLIILALPLTVFAEMLDLDMAIEQAFAKSSEQQKSLLEHADANSRFKSAYLNALPEARVNMSKKLEGGDQELATFNFHLSKSLSLSESDYFSIKKAKLDKDDAREKLAHARRKIAYTVFESYIMVLKAEKKLQIAAESLTLQTKMLAQIQGLFDAHRSTVLDLKQKKIGVLDAEIAVQLAQDEYKKRTEDFALYLDIESNDLQLSDIEINMDYTASYQKSYSLNSLARDIRKIKYDEQASFLDFLPQMNISYTYGYNDSNPGIMKSIDGKNATDGHTVSLNASYSLFNYWQHRENHRRTRNSMRRSVISLDNLTRAQQNEFTRLTREYASAKQRYELIKQKKELSDENLALASENYRLGRIDLIELEKARIGLVEAKIKTVEYKYEIGLIVEQLNLLVAKKILGKY